MNKIRYVNIATTLEKEEMITLAMEKMANGELEYEVRQVEIEDNSKIELFNENNTILIMVNSDKQVADDLFRFFNLYIESEHSIRIKILATLEILKGLYKKFQPEILEINILESIEGIGNINSPIVEVENNNHLRYKSDKDIFYYLINNAEFYENEKEIIYKVLNNEEYDVEYLKELLLTSLSLTHEDFEEYETLGHMFLYENDNVIKTKYGYIYSDFML